jgi:4-carboxymuconolactone decarboxylase
MPHLPRRYGPATERASPTTLRGYYDAAIDDKPGLEPLNQERLLMNDELFEKGLEIRKSVLGAEFVEKSIAAADDFNMPLQRLVTEYCWGACWGREELPKKMRSLLNLAMLSTLGRNHELKMHTKGAIRNGCTKEEIREVLLQVAIYAGVPAAVDSFRVAKEALNELEQETAKA